ncbi:MAG TPA: hypothetical protein VK487_10990 [Candidatus Bathyarchaeia archaeon]|nr:hypothetical protein [Candidatus Bathyarchaeia archaeon]
MVKCPDCKREFEKRKKEWNYGQFKVEAYTCECGTDLRDYSRKGKHSFFLKKSKKDKRYVKA